MTHYIDLFSPETYEIFTNTDRSISGFRLRQSHMAKRVMVGDKFICYMTKLGRWVGILEVESECFEDKTPIYSPEDPFIVRFKVRPIVWLSMEKAIPIREGFVWNSLSFTKGIDIKSSKWTGKLRNSLNPLIENDGLFLETEIINQASLEKIYLLDDDDKKKLITHNVKREDKVVSVSIPEDFPSEEHEKEEIVHEEVRESIKMQAMLASIGSQMGMKIWIPKNDRAAVLREWKSDTKPILETLPLNYDEVTL